MCVRMCVCRTLCTYGRYICILQFLYKKKQCPVESHPQEESILQRVFDPDTHTHPHTLYMTRYTFQFLKKIYICV